MSVKITVPSLGESVSTATVVQWFVKPGGHIAQDQKLCEVESDKATMEIPAPVSGVLVEILKKEGDDVAIGDTIGLIEPGEGVEAGRPQASPQVKPSDVPSTSGHQTAPAQTTIPGSPSDLPQSPAVRRLVEEHAVDPDAVTGSGLGGRLTKGDVLQHVEQRGAAPAAQAQPARAQAPTTQAPAQQAPAQAPRTGVDDSRVERVRMTALRRKVAERLVQVQQTAAILTTFNEIDMGAVMELRKEHQDAFTKKYGIKLGFMSFFVKACIDALKMHPGVNAEIQGDEILYKHFYDIGVAVGGGKGLVVPVIRDADRLSFAQLEKAIAEMGTKARENKLTTAELTGGTFTISNGGIYGSLMSTPILNPPQTGILGMHKIQDRPMAVNGQVVIRPMMYVALSYDHRVIDGREAVGFLVRVKECLEQPSRMLVEV